MPTETHLKAKTIGLILTCVVGGLLGCLLLVLPEIRYRAVVKKYPPGTRGELILRDYGNIVQIQPSGNVLPFEPTAEQRRSHPFYLIVITNANAEIYLNYYRQVLRISRIAELRNPK